MVLPYVFKWIAFPINMTLYVMQLVKWSTRSVDYNEYFVVESHTIPRLLWWSGMEVLVVLRIRSHLPLTKTSEVWQPCAYSTQCHDRERESWWSWLSARSNQIHDSWFGWFLPKSGQNLKVYTFKDFQSARSKIIN